MGVCTQHSKSLRLNTSDDRLPAREAMHENELLLKTELCYLAAYRQNELLLKTELCYLSAYRQNELLLKTEK